VDLNATVSASQHSAAAADNDNASFHTCLSMCSFSSINSDIDVNTVPYFDPLQLSAENINGKPNFQRCIHDCNNFHDPKDFRDPLCLWGNAPAAKHASINRSTNWSTAINGSANKANAISISGRGSINGFPSAREQPRKNDTSVSNRHISDELIANASAPETRTTFTTASNSSQPDSRSGAKVKNNSSPANARNISRYFTANASASNNPVSKTFTQSAINRFSATVNGSASSRRETPGENKRSAANKKTFDHFVTNHSKPASESLLNRTFTTAVNGCSAVDRSTRPKETSKKNNSFAANGIISDHFIASGSEPPDSLLDKTFSSLHISEDDDDAVGQSWLSSDLTTITALSNDDSSCSLHSVRIERQPVSDGDNNERCRLVETLLIPTDDLDADTSCRHANLECSYLSDDRSKLRDWKENSDSKSNDEDKETVVPAEVTALSAAELRKRLGEFGESPGPVTDTTRHLHELKLSRLLAGGDKHTITTAEHPDSAG